MIIELLLAFLATRTIDAILVIGVVMIAILFFVVLWLRRKFWLMRGLAEATGGKMMLILDEGARQAWFYPIQRTHDENFIKERGIRFWDREGTFFSPQLLCSLGICTSDIAVTLPTKYHKYFNRHINPDTGEVPERQIQIGTETTQKVSKDPETGDETIEEIVKPVFEWVTFDGYTQFLAKWLDPFRKQSVIEYRGRMFGKLNDMDRADQGGGSMLKKLLPILLIMGVVGIAIFFLLKG